MCKDSARIVAMVLFPSEQSIIRLIGAVLIEHNDEWQTQHRYMQVEGMARLVPPTIDGEATPLPSAQIIPQAA